MTTKVSIATLEPEELARACGGESQQSFGTKAAHAGVAATAAGVGGMVSWALGTGAAVAIGVTTRILPKHAGNRWSPAGKLLVYGTGLAAGAAGAWYTGKAAW